MSFYLYIILIQSILILAWVYFVKSKHQEIPEFDSWLTDLLSYNPNVSLESAFEEYIIKYDIMVLQDSGEPMARAMTRTKLQLIENYNIDAVLQGSQNYDGYKSSLMQAVNK